MGELIDNLRGAWRMLARHRGSTALIAGLLALGIGACTIIFSVFYAVFLRSLPVKQPGDLVMLVQYYQKLLGYRSELPYFYYESLRDHAKSLVPFGETWPAESVMTQPVPAEQISLRAVTGDYFEIVGAHALYGRILLPTDARREPGNPPAVLSYDFWQRRFNGDPRVTRGRSALIDKQYFAVVGVMPRGFNGLSADTAPDIWIPLRTFAATVYPSIKNFRLERMNLEIDGRLRHGFTAAQAQAECRTTFVPAMKDYYLNILKFPAGGLQEELNRKVLLQPLVHGTSTLRQTFGSALKLLMASAALLLLIVCSNVGGLLLAQAATRQREFAVRLAVGATRGRLMRQALVEGLLLTTLGATGGLLIARVAMPLIPRIMPPMRSLDTTLVPLSLRVGLVGQVVWFLVAASLITMLLFSVSPVLLVSRSRLESLLRAARASSGVRGRQALIAFQIMLCTFLLVMAALFMRTLRQLDRVNSGMDVYHIATFTGDLTGYKNGPAFLKTLTERVRGIPGVISCGLSQIGVMREHGTFMTVVPAGHRVTQADFLDAATNAVSPSFFETMGMRILEGRGFTAADAWNPKKEPPFPAVVNETFAGHFFPDTDPVGKFFGSAGTRSVATAEDEIIGVVTDAKDRALREPIPPTVYGAGGNFQSFVLYVRTPMRPEAIIEPVRKLWRSEGPGVPLLEVDSLAEEVGQTTANERLTAALTSLFAAIAALLAGIGIYGLLAYVVTQRRQEIGIRMALGAQPWHIAKLISRQTLIMMVVGGAGGVGLALLAGSAIRSLLYGISPEDPRSLAAAIFFVALTSTLATVFPVLRAIHTEPAAALRQEN